MMEQERKTQAARELASLRRRVAGVCAICGTPFEGTTKRRYCSQQCANVASYRAHKEERMERQRERRRQQRTAQEQAGR